MKKTAFYEFYLYYSPWQAFRPGATDLPAGATEVASGAINDEQRFGNFYDDRMDGDLIIDAFDR